MKARLIIKVVGVASFVEFGVKISARIFWQYRNGNQAKVEKGKMRTDNGRKKNIKEAIRQ